MDVPRLLSVTEAMQALGIGRSSLYSLIAENKIRIVKIGRRTLISDQEITRFVNDLTSEDG